MFEPHFGRHTVRGLLVVVRLAWNDLARDPDQAGHNAHPQGRRLSCRVNDVRPSFPPAAKIDTIVIHPMTWPRSPSWKRLNFRSAFAITGCGAGCPRRIWRKPRT